MILVGIGSLCLAGLAVFLWISGDEGNSSASGQFSDRSQPLETPPAPGEIAEAVVPRDLPQVDEVMEEIPPQDRDASPDLHSISAIKSPGLTHAVPAEESNFAGKVESTHPVPPGAVPPGAVPPGAVPPGAVPPAGNADRTSAARSGKEVIDSPSNSGKEVVEPQSRSGKEGIGSSLSGSGKHVIESMGKGAQEGSGGSAESPGSGGFNNPGLYNSAADEGTRRVLPYLPIKGATALGGTAVLANRSSGGCPGSREAGSSFGDGNSLNGSEDGRGLPARNAERTNLLSGSEATGESGTSTGSGSSGETSATDSGEGITSDPQRRPFREVPLLIGPPALPPVAFSQAATSP